MRGNTLAAQNAEKTHCPEGHPYSVENTYIPPNSHERQCRICRAAAGARWRAKP
jgi:hypothetical protein